MPKYIITAAVHFEVEAQNENEAWATLDKKAKDLMTMSAQDAGAYEVASTGHEAGIQKSM